jgi:hypothetical protein
MAKLNFAQRFSADKQFRAAVEKIHLEAVLESAGIDPEALNAMYEAGVRPLTLSAYKEQAKPKAPAAPKKKAAAKKKSSEPKAD